MDFTYNFILEYLPTRFAATSEQQENRQRVYAFKKGNYSQSTKDLFAGMVNEIVGNRPSDWVVLFIPASSELKTRIRFAELARHIESKTGVRSTIEGIVAVGETESQCLSGRRFDKTGSYNFNSSVYQGKKVILIDDVITSGRSFYNCAMKLIRTGAVSVRGLFLAKTINPEWNSHVA